MHSKKRVVSLILACLITLVGTFSIGGVLATELIEKDTYSQTKDNSKEAVLIDVGENGLEEKEIKMIEIVAATNTIGYISEDGMKTYKEKNIKGGQVFNIDAETYNNEHKMISVDYDGKTLYLLKDNVLEVTGPEEDVITTINALKEKYETEAQNIIYTVPAETYYSVNGKTLDYKYQDYIWSLCKYWGIEKYYPKLLCQFYHESGYNQAAVSSTNDYGICQLNGRYHEGFKRYVGHMDWDLIEDPYANMYVGVWLMARNIRNRGGNFDIAMTDYNAGGGYYAKHGIREVYCNRVNSLYKNSLEVIDPSSNA